MNEINHLYTQAIAMTTLAVVLDGPLQYAAALVAALHVGLALWAMFEEREDLR